MGWSDVVTSQEIWAVSKRWKKQGIELLFNSPEGTAFDFSPLRPILDF